MKINEALRGALRGLLVEVRNEQAARISAKVAEARLDLVWAEANQILIKAEAEATTDE